MISRSDGSPWRISFPLDRNEPEVWNACAWFAAVGGWCTLSLSGRWRPEASWIDRSGRLGGVTWIGVTVLSWSRYLLI